MVNYIQFPLAVHNLFGPNKNKKLRRATIIAFLNAAKGGMGAFNELAVADRLFLRAEAKKRGLRSYWYVANGLVWSPRIGNNGRARLRTIMRGGYVGADGVATKKKGDDDRRVGPSRNGVYVPFDFPAIDLYDDFEIVITHLMAKWTTTHKWRAALARKSIVSLGMGVVENNGLCVGDMNTNDYVDLPGVADVPVPTPATYGRRKYDQILRWGPHVIVTRVREVNTPSDHDMVTALVTVYRKPNANIPVPTLKPAVKKTKLPRPGQRGVNWKRYGAPVKHPWAGKNLRWRRRHKKLWNRILKWRIAYKRRL